MASPCDCRLLWPLLNCQPAIRSWGWSQRSRTSSGKIISWRQFCLFSFFASKGRVLFFLTFCFYTLENFSRLHHLFGQLPRGTLTSSVLFYPKMQGTNRPNTIQDTILYNIHYCFLTGPPQKEQFFFHIIIFTRLKRNSRIMKLLSLFRFFKTQNFIFVYH